MPRKAREKSNTGIYHVMFRGINRQIIFYDNEDYERFIHVLRDFKKVCGYELYAYCLMSNHIHLLIKEGAEDLSNIFRRIGASFVYWYNRKYNRIGHLFQDRYKSEPVEDDQYFLTVLRYIHQNPIKVGIVKEIVAFPWSSYNEYIGNRDLCEVDYTLSFFASKPKEALRSFHQFHKELSNDQCLEYEENNKINDMEAMQIIVELTGQDAPEKINDFAQEQRNQIIKELKRKGLSIRQIERLTKVKFSVIRKI